ncbi:FadR/GntR family transcriptional regulator [Lacrimispora sp.]|uniref:FadR/GntR family transcriptional regulator n=1 Tax=Lacrimispora sp. TaxID=2719234 RepID=UPI00345FB08F
MCGSPKDSRPLIDKTADNIVSYIIRNELKPGDRLPPEHELTELLEVGRSTLREAIRMLASRNVLEVRHGSGSFISPKAGVADDPFGFSFIRDKHKLAEDLIEFRMMIEPRIAASAATGCTEEEKLLLQAQCEKVEKLIEAGEDYSEEDSRLHTMISSCGRNCVMPKLMPIITSSIRLLIELTNASLRDETVRTHRAIVDAICDGDSLAAYDAMMLHLIYNRDRLREEPLIAYTRA